MTLLLGPFEDGELEPHEMQEVARHLATCKSCEELLGEYSAIGRELREIITIPPLTGFAAGVNARIEELRPPLRERIGAFFESLNQRWAAAFAMVSMAGAVAVLTALVLTPYLRSSGAKGGAPVAPMAKAETNASSLASTTTDQEGARSMMPSQDQQLASTTDMNPGDSHAVIKRLESQIPTTAVWSEPENGTTVIWLPSEQ
jgi:negative regulator of sigma E activity